MIILFHLFSCTIRIKADESYRLKILLTKTIPPIKRYIAAFNNKVLLILNSSLYYLSNDWPKIVCKFNIVFWGEKRKEPVSRFFSKTFHFVYTRYLRFLFPVLSDPRISS